MTRDLMPVTLASSPLATISRHTRPWTGGYDHTHLHLGSEAPIPLQHISGVGIRRSLLWSDLTITHDGHNTTLLGLRHGDAARAVTHLQAAVDECRRDVAVLAELHHTAPGIAAWWVQVNTVMTQPRWVTRAQVADLERTRPRSASPTLLADCWAKPSLASSLATFPADWREAVIGWARINLPRWAASHNEDLARWEKATRRDWFDTIEKTPLTDEQIDAVIRFDTRTRVIAAAGSGKTSTMVAKAAYAVDRGLVEPHRILMLAFNKKAATELGDRTAGKISGQAKPNATTFHAFGLNVIGEVRGSQPSVAPGPDTREGAQRLSGIVDQLRDSDPQFRRDWDLFRLVFGKALERFGEPDDPDIDSGPKAGYKTLQGEIVASRGELMIANWLWYHGVSYVYEQPYEHDVSDLHHRQYQPDFYYPDLGVYHEHWGLDRNGQPAPHMIGYLDSVAWRRQTHRTYGTTLLETTWATIMDGTGFDYLTKQLTRLGAALDENPYRKPAGEEPLDDAGMLALVGTFMVHAKSNRLDLAKVVAPGLRDQLFLRLVGPILHLWDAQLQAEKLVDFEDMLNQAADLIGTGRWVSPYRLVMVDEMQDTSVARARLVQALVGQDPHHRLFAVGDDWQAINRFAGADMSIMAGFEDWFGPADTCLLSRTFRSNQTISDVATQFVTANPAQLRKHVTSYRLGEPGAVRALAAAWGQTGAAVTKHLKRLDDDADSPVSVLLLGRYNHDADQLSASLQRRWRHLQVRYQTVHASKGAEADHVVVVANASRFGFPSRQQDDPILRLAMPAPDDFRYAEERRLFYVALTRAKESVLIVTLDGRESPFVLELVKAGQVELRKTTGGPITLCPACGRGTVTPRTSRYGPFLGCSRYPRCGWKQSRH